MCGNCTGETTAVHPPRLAREGEPRDSRPPWQAPDPGRLQEEGWKWNFRPANKDAGQPKRIAEAVPPGPIQAGDVFRASNEPLSARDIWNKSIAFKEGLGVEVVSKDNGTVDYLLKAGGKEYLLAQSEATEEGFKKAEARIKKLATEKAAVLEKEYNVHFSREGEQVDRSWRKSAEGTWVRGDMVTARAPRLDELMGIERALPKSYPSITRGDNLTFYFLKSDYWEGGGKSAYFINADKNNKPAIYFHPGIIESTVATESDNAPVGKNSFEYLITHELAHNGQHKNKFEVMEGNLDKLGWTKAIDRNTYATTYILKGNDGNLYRRATIYSDGDIWLRCNKDAEPVDDNGRVVPENQAYALMNSSMRERALIKPATSYFTNPYEAHADGLAVFRLGEERRAKLLKESPKMYQAIKHLDDEEIARIYGRDSKGQPRYLRGPDGYLLERTPVNIVLVNDFERKVATGRIG